MRRRDSGCDRVRGGSESCSDDPAVAQHHVRTACERACLFVARIRDIAIHLYGFVVDGHGFAMRRSFWHLMRAYSKEHIRSGSEFGSDHGRPRFGALEG